MFNFLSLFLVSFSRDMPRTDGAAGYRRASFRNYTNTHMQIPIDFGALSQSNAASVRIWANIRGTYTYFDISLLYIHLCISSLYSEINSTVLRVEFLLRIIGILNAWCVSCIFET